MPRGKKKEPAKLAEAPGANDDTLAGPVRRSDRARKPVEFYGVVSVPSPAKAAPAKKPRGKATPTKATDDENPEKDVPVGEASAEEPEPEPEPSTRRNRKRKAAPGNLEDPTDLPVPDNLLEAALAPWGQNEQDKDWLSWMTLESDPEYFTYVIQKLGVKGVKIEDCLQYDEEYLKTMPEPLHGLIFLFNLGGAEDYDAGVEVDDAELPWFANQTTNDACATISLLNLVMNAEGLALGEKLRSFKDESKELSPPLRGDLITRSSWIRVAHNSFSRRLDHLNAALKLDNNADEKVASKKKKKAAKPKAKAKPKVKPKAKPKSKGKAKGKSKAKKADDDDDGDDDGGGDDDDESVASVASTASVPDLSYHFIAFVPVGNKVWQLDGIHHSPVLVGEFAEDKDWFSLTCPVIKQMCDDQGEHIRFNLLAMCGTALGKLRKDLAVSVACLNALQSKWSDSGFWSELEGDDANVIVSSDSAELAQYDLDQSAVDCLSRRSKDLDDTKRKACAGWSDVFDALERRENFCRKQRVLRDKYAVELVLNENEMESGPQLGLLKDYTPAIHEWVKKLAEHHVLDELYATAVAQRK